MKLIKPITNIHQLADVENRQTVVGLNKVYREVPFVQNLIISRRQHTQHRRIPIIFKVRF